jgi:excisionase family DNA binding protein
LVQHQPATSSALQQTHLNAPAEHRGLCREVAMGTHSTRLLRVSRTELRPDHVGVRAVTADSDTNAAALPLLLSVDEAADLLRTSRRAIYAMVERKQLPGVTRIRRRVLIRTTELLDWVDQKRAPSLEE